MTKLDELYIAGSDIGLQLNKKPYLLPDKAFSKLENAYVYRDRVIKRQALRSLGRLRRVFTGADVRSLGVTVALQTTYTYADIFASFIPPLGAAEPDKSIEPGSLVITIAAPDAATFTDNGLGGFTVTGAGVAAGSSVNYATGAVTIVLTASAGGAAITAAINYFPNLPVMGIADREISSVNDEETFFFDTVYAYKFVGSGFQEAIPGTVWTGTDYDFFWTTNYRGVTADSRLFFVTNFSLLDPMRYTDGNTWTTFQPIISDNPPSAAQSLLYKAKILIPYYGRLIALNTFEGTTAGGVAAAGNFFARARFSRIGDPTAVDSWRSDQFGKGGFIDAPTNESIMSAIFFKNTLIVSFERSTWQLRYVGEYGLPFLWERISSDFGSESKMSGILFDQGVAVVGDKAITSSNSINVQRIDEQIPDVVFGFRNAEQGIERVNGIRDFQRQLVFWNYSDSNLRRKFPNRVLVYNYENATYAIFRDNVTAFGTFQAQGGNILWDSLDIFWDDDDVFWDDFDTQSLFPSIVIGNQQGFISYYGYNSLDEPSLYIQSITLANPITLVIPDHNLEDLEIIQLKGLLFTTSAGVPIATDLNDRIFQVTRVDADTITLSEWDGTDYVTDYSFTPDNTNIYIGGGLVALFPKMDIQTKDFNPYDKKANQVKLAYIDFLTDVPGNPDAAMTVELLLNSSPIAIGNVIVGNKDVEQYLPAPYYLPLSDYAWHRFYATTTGQYIKVRMTYSDALMNQLSTHTSSWVLNAMSLYVKMGGRNPF